MVCNREFIFISLANSSLITDFVQIICNGLKKLFLSMRNSPAYFLKKKKKKLHVSLKLHLFKLISRVFTFMVITKL